jgi:hypothetical protein
LAEAYDNGGGLVYFTPPGTLPNVNDPEIFPQGRPGVDWGLDTAQLTIRSDGTYQLKLKGYGFPTEAPIDVYHANPSTVATHPVYQVAFFTSPVSASTAAYNNGRDISSPDPDVLRVKKSGDWEFLADLDYDPRAALAVPLVNRVGAITQTAFDESYSDGTVEYANLKQNVYGEATVAQAIASEYIRLFNDDGTVMLDERGNPMIARHPVAMNEIAIRVNFDGTSSGLVPRISNVNSFVLIRFCFKEGPGACANVFPPL